MLQANTPPTRFDPTLIVPLPGTRKAGFKQIVACQRRKTLGELDLPAVQPATTNDGCREVVINQACGHTLKVLEGADVSIEKSQLITTFIKPGEIKARSHQATDKFPDGPAHACQINRHFKEIDLCHITGLIQQRDEHF